VKKWGEKKRGRERWRKRCTWKRKCVLRKEKGALKSEKVKYFEIKFESY
jgi:hypothetical protein